MVDSMPDNAPPVKKYVVKLSFWKALVKLIPPAKINCIAQPKNNIIVMQAQKPNSFGK